ncbi:MAG: Cd(II)/Pb(II)-responsive transcriptional regulator 2 [uncultured bacterium]|jgi:Cd(II)/Pb(II)-responsive transcriptional regulator|nr:MAG: Cd(II)/Pb(II)-responsive transcriptional regulator 2 [uncultured bacterium]
MKIGELAKSSDCPVQTIRYYEAEGLLLAPARSHGNFRVYSESDLERLRFIRQCRSRNMTLNEVRTLLTFRDRPELDCGEVNDLVDDHISKVRIQIRALKELERELLELRRSCDTVRSAKECGILMGLAKTH